MSHNYNALREDISLALAFQKNGHSHAFKTEKYAKDPEKNLH
jgi:hypothetical protein